MGKAEEATIHTMASILTAEAIKQIKDIEVREIFVEPWDMSVCLRTPNALEKGKFEATVAAGDRDIKTLKMRMCLMSICDKDGTLLFPDIDEGIKVLGDKSCQAIEIIANEVLTMIQITKEELEVATKN